MSDIDVLATDQDQFSDDEFDAFVKSNQQEQNSNNTNNRVQFADILYTNIPQQTQSDPEAMRLVRFRGGPPNSDRTAYTARSMVSSLVRDDANKLFKLKLPIADRGHLYWRIINTVLEKDGRGAAATFKHAERFPEIFNRIRYGVAKPTSNQYKYENGWRGREWLVANVIDREMMGIHREMKHTAILCKNATASRKNPDVVFYDDGVPAYGFISALTLSLFKPYKNWENYDVGIVRTGQKTMPYRVFNASRYLPEVPEQLQSLVGEEGSVTDEEMGWGMYDLRKLSRITSYNRFLEKVGQLIFEIDTALGTTFFDELQSLATKEKAEWEDGKGEDEDATPSTTAAQPAPSTPNVTADPIPTKTRIRATAAPVPVPEESSSDEVLAEFKEKLTQNGFTEEELDSIIGYNPDSLNLIDRIKYKVPVEMLVACNHEGCGGPSPEFFHKCPHCLKAFD